MKRDIRWEKAIRNLEPIFFKAGELAVKLQRGISPKKKFSTGTYEVDVVTDADLQVQEMILSAACKTDLSRCRLVAEETTLIKNFDPDGELLLAIDPIDGTYRYVAGGPIYSVIVSIQSPGMPLYTFAHYPVLGWTHRFIGTAHHEDGKRPTLPLNRSGSKVIAYSYGDPGKKVPERILREMKDRGYSFVDKKELNAGDCGATSLLLASVVDGYYCEDPLAVDGLVGMHYALAHGCEMKNSVPAEWPKSGFGGIRYPGYYFIVANRPTT